MLGASGMMDGQVGFVRAVLDDAGHIDTSIPPMRQSMRAPSMGHSAMPLRANSRATARLTSRTRATCAKACARFA
jgi:delta-aminolevulinic acid dehydratase/porphobilinogen synthase